MIGSTLLHYTVDACLGQGGMGTVYHARETVLSRTVAIEVLAAGDEEATRRLLHEARAASALNHPNSVTIHAVEQHGATAFIVMAHVEGVSPERDPDRQAADRSGARCSARRLPRNVTPCCPAVTSPRARKKCSRRFSTGRTI